MTVFLIVYMPCKLCHERIHKLLQTIESFADAHTTFTDVNFTEQHYYRLAIIGVQRGEGWGVPP